MMSATGGYVRGGEGETQAGGGGGIFPVPERGCVWKNLKDVTHRFGELETAISGGIKKVGEEINGENRRLRVGELLPLSGGKSQSPRSRMNGKSGGAFERRKGAHKNFQLEGGGSYARVKRY